MQTIGMIGGMSWESSLEYYRIVNQAVKEKLGGFHSAKCVMYSVDFQDIESLQHAGEWGAASLMMQDAAKRVERAGADVIVICTNTMHLMADDVKEAVNIPLLHIADVTAEAILANKQKTVGLLGTRFTMEKDFYKERLQDKFGLRVIIPEEPDRIAIHSILYNELCLGQIKEPSQEAFRQITQKLVSKGAEGIILGCTEIPLIVHQENYQIPSYDTTDLHARAAVKFALA